MADTSRNPEDQAAMSRLEAKLAGVEKELAAQRRAGEEQLREDRSSKQQARRDTQRATREGRGRPPGRAGDTSGPRVADEAQEPALIDKSTSATERRIAAERSLGQQIRARIRLENEAAYQSRLPVTQRPGTPGAVIRAQGYVAQQAGQRIAYDQARAEAERARSAIAQQYEYRRQYIPPSRQLGAGLRGRDGEQLQLPAAGGTGGGAPPRPPPTAGGGAYDDSNFRQYQQRVKEGGAATRDLSKEEKILYAQAREAAQGQSGLSGALQATTRNIGLSSTAFRAHGALNTDFIAAAAKGEVTMRELGFQTGATIAKFGGWTAAAGAVYGAVAAIGALGKGALEAQSGVGLLSRVQTKQLPGGADALQQQFRDLSAQFNLPIKDTVDTVYGAAKAFGGDLPQALEGAKAALFAVKVGELDAATSTRYLTSIVNGFGLTGKDTVDVFDAINQAQNRFGGNTGQMVEGVAKAAGAFKLAGGNYRELIALITEGSRLTGRPGGEIGTAITRAASSTLTKQGQQRLKAAGLDPTQKFPEILAEASKQAQGASPQRVNELARALIPAGGQYARIFAPILQNKGLYDKIFSEISPDKAKGSGQRELQRALTQPNEQLKQLVVNAERLGSALAVSGALTPFYILLRLVNEVLGGFVRLVEMFHKLSLGADQFLIPILELGAALKVLRHFDVGGSLPIAKAPGSAYGAFREQLRASPEQRLNKQILRGTEDEKTFLQNERASTAQAAGRSVFQAQRAVDRRDQLISAGAAPKEVIAAQRAVNTRLEEAATLTADEAALVAQQNALKVQVNEYERLRATGLEASVAASRAGIGYGPGTFERPVAQRAKTIEEMRRQAYGGTGFMPKGAVDLSPALAAEEEAATAASAQSGLAAKSRAANERLRSLSESSRLSGVSGKALGAAARGAGSAVEFAGTTAAAAGAGMRTLGAAQVGALDGILLLAIAIPEIYSIVKSKIDDTNKRIADLQKMSGDPQKDAAKAQQAIQSEGFFDHVRDTFADYVNNNPITNALGIHAQSPHQRVEEEAKKAAQAARTTANAQAHGHLLTDSTIQTNLSYRLAGADKNKDTIAAYDQAIKEIEGGFSKALGTPGEAAAADALKAEIIAKKRDALAAAGSVWAAIHAITNVDELQKFVDSTGDQFALYGPTKTNFRRSGAQIAKARELLATDPANAKKYAAQIKSSQDQAQQAAQADLNRVLPYAQSPAQGGRERAQYLARMREVLLGGSEHEVRGLTKTTTDRQKEIDRLTKETKTGDTGPVSADRQAEHQDSKLVRLRQLTEAQKQDKKRLEELRKQMGLSKKEFEAIRREQQRAQFEAEQAVFEATTQAGAAGIADTLGKLEFELSRNDQRLGKIAHEYGVQSTQYQGALAKHRDLQQQIVQEELARFQLGQELSVAQANIGAGEGDKLRRTLSTAQAYAAHVASLGSAVDSKVYLQALVAVANAKAALADYLNQQAYALITAQAAYDTSLTEDPIKQAQIKLTESAKTLRRTNTDPTKTQADRLNARAQYNDAVRAKRQTVQREKFNNIEFDAELENISKDTELARLGALLKTIKGNRDLKREIERRMHALQKEIDSSTGLELNLGSIKLPTAYEIRRAVLGGTDPGRSVLVRNDNVFHIDATAGREAAVGDQIAAALGGSTAGALRSMTPGTLGG